MVLQALDFIRRIKQKYELNRLICMGDLVDIHTGGRWGQLPGAHGAKTEWELAVEMIGELTDMFPNALMAIGNHDARAFRAASKMGITDEMIKSINDVYKLPPTWKLYQNFRYNTVYGPCMVMHGHDFSGPGAADKWYNKLHTSVIIGHVHTAPGMRFYQTPDGTRYSAIIPCLADEKSVAMEYAAAFGGCFVNGCAVSVPDLFTFEIIPDSKTGDSL
jgi:metallophosphoesterase superfamily enzyme